MTEDGDRVDPVVTELSRYKGLLKVQVLENERLRERIVELDAFLVIANEQQVAVENENGELRGIIQQATDDVVAASYPRKMHLEWLEAARKVLAEDDHIASADCWCKPTELEEGIFVHNSVGRREKREEGELQ
jgi:hypothetical protein